MVQVPAILPNCFVSTHWEIAGAIHLFTTIVSKTLATMGVSEIGRRSVSIDVGGPFFVSGTTSADFHILGTIPSLRELLKILASGGART